MSENNNKSKSKHSPGWELTVPFFLALAILTVVSFIVPLRPTQSYTEKRNLAEFPEFSWEALYSGSSGIDHEHSVSLRVTDYLQDMRMTADEYIRMISVQKLTGLYVISTGISSYMRHQDMHPGE